MSYFNDFENDSTTNFQNQEAINPTLNKIANFLDMKGIYIGQFWQSHRNYASMDDLEKFCENCGLKLSIHDQINFKNQMFSKKEVISIYQFSDLIPQWKNKGMEMISNFLKERSEILVQNLNSKHKNQRIKSTSNLQTRPASGITTNFDTNKGRMFSASKQPVKSFKPNNSRKYLEQNRLKNMKKEQQLSETIEKTKNEHEYSMLMKMNELNQYNHKNKSTITYRAYKNAEGMIKVRVFELENFIKELSIQEFESEFKIFKKSTKQNKQWQKPMSIKMAHTIELMTKTFQSTGSKNQKKQQRQQQLRNLLADTVSLTKLLQDQIRIFKMKGIYGCENF